MNKEGYKELIQKNFDIRVKQLNFHFPETPEVWRIKIDGEFVILRSGKTRWAKIGHAKNALRNHFGRYFPYVKVIPVISYQERCKIAEDIYQKYLNEKVEFVNICKPL